MERRYQTFIIKVGKDCSDKTDIKMKLLKSAFPNSINMIHIFFLSIELIKVIYINLLLFENNTTLSFVLDHTEEHENNKKHFHFTT